MALGHDYAQQNCSLARALELVGERWTLLIIRDAFFGVRRFNDFQEHLDISKAVLTQRLSKLVANGLLTRQPVGGRDEYVPTEILTDLWPALYALTAWGEKYAPAPLGRRRFFTHTECGERLSETGWCTRCGRIPLPEATVMHPGPGTAATATSEISVALRAPRRLLEPLR
ncbi:DNA-binding HxlR family transcriptional regulator [Rhodococcus sp. 27YEA15]|uniref:winged helix-turn-helix transcriptional regulator n=1 Tax=Rhodococcus sp. 27YEA15 TaxID=3156259 RepID=UPI003C7BE855